MSKTTSPAVAKSAASSAFSSTSAAIIPARSRELLDVLKTRVVIADGAMGTMLTSKQESTASSRTPLARKRGFCA